MVLQVTLDIRLQRYIIRATTYLRCLILPLLLQMPPPSTNTGPSEQSGSPPPTNDPRAPGSDDPEDQQADPGVWKRRFLALQENMNTEGSSKRKPE